jgi:deazaflavin-dependent oxidoreductase (nitroreductase family)
VDTAPYRKPDFFTLKVMQPLFAALGIAPTLTVRGRKTGKAYSFPVLLAESEGRRYLVAPRGNTQWARNLRVAGEAELKVRRQRRRVRATEVPASQRQPIIDAYRQQHAKDYGRFLAAEFAAIPDAADHPVFLLEDL